MLVATPGRLLDHLKHTAALKLHNVSWLVLDEADRLLDRGFEEPLRAVLAALREQRAPTLPELPAARQTVLCSATLDARVQALAASELVNPVRVQVAHGAAAVPSSATKANAAAAAEGAADAAASEAAATPPAFVQPAQLSQTYAVVPVKLRLVALLGALHRHCKRGAPSKGIVFFSTRDSVDFHHAALSLTPPAAGGDATSTGGARGASVEPAVEAALRSLRAILHQDAAAPDGKAGAGSGEDEDTAEEAERRSDSETERQRAAAAAAGWDLPALPADKKERRAAREAARAARRAERRELRMPIRRGTIVPATLFKLHGQMPSAMRTVVYKAFCAAREVRTAHAATWAQLRALTAARFLEWMIALLPRAGRAVFHGRRSARSGHSGRGLDPAL